MELIPLFNLISRWILFLMVTYKFYREKTEGWLFMAFAFLLDALNPEVLLLEPLGVKLIKEAAFVVNMTVSSLQGILLLMAAIYLSKSRMSMRDKLKIGCLAFVIYLWLFLISIQSFSSNFTLRTSLPMTLYAIGYIYLGYVLYRYVLRRDMVQLLLPIGMVGLGVLNLSYPYTATLEWFVPHGLALGTLLRALMTIGAIKFVLFPILPPEEEVKGTVSEKRTIIFENFEDFTRSFPDLFRSNNAVIITRRDINALKKEIDRDDVVFWVTKAYEGTMNGEYRIYAISPTKIDILIDLINRELEKGYNVVYIDAFEYLVVENGFEAAAKFLISLKDRVIHNNASLIAVISMNALDLKQRKLLENEFEVFKRNHRREPYL
ncbi:hypothetical protein DRN43_00540 [Thermococci archaeon]|nr:MAG: hypothetical protein DRN43_00540 [Thermococci archaeon]